MPFCVSFLRKWNRGKSKSLSFYISVPRGQWRQLPWPLSLSMLRQPGTPTWPFKPEQVSSVAPASWHLLTLLQAVLKPVSGPAQKDRSTWVFFFGPKERGSPFFIAAAGATNTSSLFSACLLFPQETATPQANPDPAPCIHSEQPVQSGKGPSWPSLVSPSQACGLFPLAFPDHVNVPTSASTSVPVQAPLFINVQMDPSNIELYRHKKIGKEGLDLYLRAACVCVCVCVCV